MTRSRASQLGASPAMGSSDGIQLMGVPFSSGRSLLLWAGRLAPAGASRGGDDATGRRRRPVRGCKGGLAGEGRADAAGGTAGRQRREPRRSAGVEGGGERPACGGMPGCKVSWGNRMTSAPARGFVAWGMRRVGDQFSHQHRTNQARIGAPSPSASFLARREALVPAASDTRCPTPPVRPLRTRPSLVRGERTIAGRGVYGKIGLGKNVRRRIVRTYQMRQSHPRCVGPQ